MQYLILLINLKLYNKVNSFYSYKIFIIKILIISYYKFANINKSYKLITKLLYNCNFIYASYNNLTMQSLCLYYLLFEVNCAI